MAVRIGNKYITVEAEPVLWEVTRIITSTRVEITKEHDPRPTYPVPHNIDATRPPLEGDDVSGGWEVWSFWIYGNSVYRAKDVTNNHAVWVRDRLFIREQQYVDDYRAYATPKTLVVETSTLSDTEQYRRVDPYDGPVYDIFLDQASASSCNSIREAANVNSSKCDFENKITSGVTSVIKMHRNCGEIFMDPIYYRVCANANLHQGIAVPFSYGFRECLTRELEYRTADKVSHCRDDYTIDPLFYFAKGYEHNQGADVLPPSTRCRWTNRNIDFFFVNADVEFHTKEGIVDWAATETTPCEIRTTAIDSVGTRFETCKDSSDSVIRDANKVCTKIMADQLLRYYTTNDIEYIKCKVNTNYEVDFGRAKITLLYHDRVFVGFHHGYYDWDVPSIESMPVTRLPDAIKSLAVPFEQTIMHPRVLPIDSLSNIVEWCHTYLTTDLMTDAGFTVPLIGCRNFPSATDLIMTKWRCPTFPFSNTHTPPMYGRTHSGTPFINQHRDEGRVRGG